MVGYDLKALRIGRDADGDGFTGDGTPHMRPVTPGDQRYRANLRRVEAVGLERRTRHVFGPPKTTPVAPLAEHAAPYGPGHFRVVIPCGGAKLDHPALARDLYTGSQFKLTLNAARSLARPYGAGDEAIWILSARYGLVNALDTLEPYEQRIDQPGAIDATTVNRQIRRRISHGQILTSLLPAAYPRILADAHRGETLHGLGGPGEGGIGYQRGVLAETIKLEPFRRDALGRMAQRGNRVK